MAYIADTEEEEMEIDLLFRCAVGQSTSLLENGILIVVHLLKNVVV